MTTRMDTLEFSYVFTYAAEAGNVAGCRVGDCLPHRSNRVHTEPHKPLCGFRLISLAYRRDLWHFHNDALLPASVGCERAATSTGVAGSDGRCIGSDL